MNVQIHYFSDIKKSLSIFIADVDIMNVKTCGSKVFKIETQIKVKSKKLDGPSLIDWSNNTYSLNLRQISTSAGNI